MKGLNYSAIAMLADGPESQIDPLLADMLRALVPSAVDQLADVTEEVAEAEIEAEIVRVRSAAA